MSRDPHRYLEDIIEAGNAILAYTADYDYERFSQDLRTVDAVIRRFEIIGEAAKRLPAEWIASEPEIPWNAIKGFRDVFAHAYFQVDEEIVWSTVEKDLKPLLDACGRLRKAP